ncbi:MAG: leucine-rich repeat domain-containing protein [Eubacterium sp.]|nr:leucine-rich repeat domain-containing protein [Eubacterium sp.]
MKKRMAAIVMAACLVFTGGVSSWADTGAQEFGTFSEVQSYAKILVDSTGATTTDNSNVNVSGGTVTGESMTGVTISMATDTATGNGVAIDLAANTDKYLIEDCNISVNAGEVNNTLGYEAACGVGVGVDTGELWIKDSTIKSSGSRSTPVYLFGNSDTEATSLVVQDSTLTAEGDVWMPGFKLLMGGARATLLMTADNSWFYGATLTAQNWGALSQDSVDAYSYAINTTSTAKEGGYASYLTYGLRSYGSGFYAGQYGIFMCGNTDVITDTGAAALADSDAMSKISDYDVDGTAQTEIVAPFNALVVHTSTPDLTKVATAVFKNTLISTQTSDLPSGVTAVSYDDEFLLESPNTAGTGNTCGAPYFFSKNLYGSAALIRSMNADFTFDNCEVDSSNGVLLQSVITFDPPSACGYLDVGGADSVAGITATYENGSYDGDILHQDYQRAMAVNLEAKATLTGAIVSGTYAGWNDLWSEENLRAALAEDGIDESVFNNDSWVSDVQANLILSDDTAYGAEENIGVDVVVKDGAVWNVNGESSLSSLTVEEGGTVQAADGYSIVIYERCDASNANTSYSTTGGTVVSALEAGETYSNVVIKVTKDATASDDGQSASDGSSTLSVGDKFTAGKLVYKVTSANAVSVVGVKSKAVKKLTVPATVKNGSVSYKVTAIGAKAFKSCKKLKTLTVKSTSIKKVAKNAFKGCKKLKTVKIKKGKTFKKTKKLFKKAVSKKVKFKKC